MDDCEIVDLFWQRNECAIDATARKYGTYCYSIAHNILCNREDAEETVNDTYVGAWNSMPHHRPTVLSTYLGKITRRISLNRWRDQNRQKRGGGVVMLAIEELGECTGSADTPEAKVALKELGGAVDAFLATLSSAERDVFLSRYWFFAGIREISQKFGYTESKVKSILFRVRVKLKEHLRMEGYI